VFATADLIKSHLNFKTEPPPDFCRPPASEDGMIIPFGGLRFTKSATFQTAHMRRSA
jgi:hypothetical protein